MNISGISAGASSGIGPVARPGAVEFDGISSGARSEQPFSKLMQEMLQEVNTSLSQVDKDVPRLATGEVQNVHEMVLNVTNADLMFRLAMEVRDRLITSYQDVMRMQI
jgi:flagellar hook-basal body complex protein FliE